MAYASCLDLKSPFVKPFVDAYGVTQTYHIYAQHDYWLPDFDAYQRQTEATVLGKEAALQFLQDRIDLNQFDVRDLQTIDTPVPTGTEAAFYQDAFYFGKQITLGAVSEEVFHAIFQRLIPVNEQDSLYSVGKALLRQQLKQMGYPSIKAYYEYMKQTAPQTYERLSEDDGYNRLYEEALAKEYVRYTTYGKTKADPYKANLINRLTPYLGTKVASFVQKLMDVLFKGLNAMRRFYNRNQFYADLFFQKINSGAYQTARIVEPGTMNSVPSTRIIKLLNDDTLSVRESNQLVKLVGGLVLQLQNDESLSDLSQDQRIDLALEAFAQQYAQQGGRGKAVSAVLQPTVFNDDTFDDEPNPEYNNIKSDVTGYLKQLRAIDSLRDESDEDERGMSEFAYFDKEANEVGGWAGMSHWIKQYIATVGNHRTINGIPQYHTIALPDGSTRQIPVIDIVDPDRVYYGLARAIANTGDLTTRLEKLLLYTQFDDTPATSAFSDQLLRDLAPVRYEPKQEVLDTLLNQYQIDKPVSSPLALVQAIHAKHPESNRIELVKQAKQAFTRIQQTNPSLIRSELAGHITNNSLDIYLSPGGKQVLIRVLKGFDLWSRTMMNMRIDPINGLSVASNANQNRAEKNLVATWEKNYLQKKKDDAISKDDLPKVYGDVGFYIDFESEKQFDALPIDTQINIINKKFEEYSKNLRTLFERLGITVSDAFVQYGYYQRAKKQYTKYPRIQEALTKTRPAQLDRLFTADNDSLITYNDIQQVKRFIEHPELNPFSRNGEKEGMRGRLERIAVGNAFFDENAFESNYLNAEGKTIYSYQNRTYSLNLQRLFGETGLTTLTSLYNTGQRTLLRYKDGKPIYLKEGDWALTENRLLKVFATDPFFQANNHLFTGFSVDGVQQNSLKRNGNLTTSVPNSVAGEGVTYGSMTPTEFDLFNLNSLVNIGFQKEGRYISPVFLGNRETSKTGEYLMLPLLEGLVDDRGVPTDEAISYFLDEIEKEYKRIQSVSKTLTYYPSGKTDKNGRELYKASYTNDVTGEYPELTNYHTGKELIKLTIPDGPTLQDVYVPTSGKDFRGLQFSDSVIGLLGDLQNRPTDPNQTNNLVIQALLGKEFNREALTDMLRQNLTSTLTQHFDRYVEEGIWDKKGDKGTRLLDKSISKSDIQNKILSDFLNGISVAQIAYGDAAQLYKNDGVDVFKRLKGLNAAIVSFAVPIAAPELGIYEPSTHYRKVTVAEPKGVSDVSGQNIDLTDAQGWQSVQTRRMSLYGQGKLSSSVSSVLDAIQEGKPVSWKQMELLSDLGIMFNSEKTVGASGVYYDKLSETMLSRELTADPHEIDEASYRQHADLDQYGRTRLKTNGLDVTSYIDENGTRRYFYWTAKPHRKNLNDQRLLMDGFRFDGNEWTFEGYDKTIQLITPISGSKTLNPNVHGDQVNGQTNWKSVEDHHIRLIDLSTYGLQTENPSGKRKIVDPTQMLEIIASELGDVHIYHEGKLISKTEIEPLWQEYLASRDKINYNVAQKVFEGEDGTLDLSLFRQKAFDSILQTGGDKQQVALFDPQNNINLNLPITRDKFISLFFAHFTKEVLSHKRAGDSLAHVSSYGHQLIKRVFTNDAGYLDWEVIRDGSQQYRQLQESGELYVLSSLTHTTYKHQFQKNPDGSKTRIEPQGENSWFTQAKALLGDLKEVYVMDSLRHLKPRWEKINGKLVQTGYFSEALYPAGNQQEQDIPSGLRYAFGVRIPSQDKHSGINLEWVDTLPNYMGSSIITPKEVVELSGSDFDIDKLYVTKFDGYWKKGIFVTYGSARTPEEKWDEFRHYALDHYKVLKTYLNDRLKQDPEYQSIRAAQELGEKGDDDLAHLDKTSLLLYLLQTPGSLSTLQKQRYEKVLSDAFSRFGLSASKEDLASRNDTWNVGEIQNKMLSLQQSLLANDITIDDNDPLGGQYNQPANLDKLNALKNEKEGNVQLFGDTGTKAIASHWPIVHSQVHQKNQVGKALIGIGVNTNLFLINAVKLGFKVNDKYMPNLIDGRTHTGTYSDRIQNPDGTTTRVFDVNSTIITADTDEAKEALNAYFNMSEDAQAVVMHIVSLGYTLLDALTFINQNVVQDYIRLSDKIKAVKAGKGIISAEDEKLGRLPGNAVIKQVLGLKITDKLPETKTKYTTDQLRKNLAATRSNEKLPYAIDTQVLLDFVALTKVNDYANNFVRFIKLKKGFGTDLENFDRIVKSGNELTGQKVPPINIYSRLQKQPNKSRQVLQLLDKILPENADIQQKILLRRSAGFTRMVESLSKTFTTYGDKGKEQVNQAVETFILTQLYLKQFEPGAFLSKYPGPDLSSVYTDGGDKQIVKQLQEFQSKYGYVRTNPVTKEIEKGLFADNPIIDLLTPVEPGNGTSTIKLNTIVKLRPEQQEELLDSFRDLFTRPGQPLEDGLPVGAKLAVELVNYFVVKDGFQFNLNNISKLFSPEVFSHISTELIEFQKGGYDSDIPSWTDQLTKAIGRDVNTTDLIPKLKLPRGETPIAKQIRQEQIIVFKNAFDQPRNNPSDQLFVKSLDPFDEKYQELINVLGFVDYPNFIQIEYNQQYSDEFGETVSTTKTNRYEKVSEGDTIHYLLVPLSGALRISYATGLGLHFNSQLKPLIEERLTIPGVVGDYYRSLLGLEESSPVQEPVADDDTPTPLIPSEPIDSDYRLDQPCA